MEFYTNTIRTDFKSQYLKIGTVGGMYYSVPERKTSRMTLYGIGAPLPPDNGILADAATILDYDTDLFVPDYIGYGRSDGEFTPTNCVKTFLQLHEALTNTCTAVSHYSNTRKILSYKEIHFVGRSFGGIYVLLLPKFNKEITNICAIFPVVDWRTLGKDKNHKEETVEGFINAMRKDGYKYLYRGILKPIWKKHFAGKDNLNPIDNIKHMGKAYVFLGHGKKDVNIYYANTENYFKGLLKSHPAQKNNYCMKLYPFDHGRRTSTNSLIDYFEWRKIKRARNDK